MTVAWSRCRSPRPRACGRRAAPRRRRPPGPRPRTAGSRRLAALGVHDPDAAEPLGEPLGQRQAAEGRGLADLGQADEGERAGEGEPAGEAGQLGDGLVGARVEVDHAEPALAGLEDPELPSCQRGECGIDRPSSTTSLDGTSHQTRRRPPCSRASRPACRSGRAPSRRLTSSSTTASPFRWQRSPGSSSLMKGGCQRGTKLCSSSSVARQENAVATNQSSPLA